MYYNEEIGKRNGYKNEEDCNNALKFLLGEDFVEHDYVCLHFEEGQRFALEEIFNRMGYEYEYEEMNDLDIINLFFKFYEKCSACQATYSYYCYLDAIRYNITTHIP
jgi:hypothetical protein